MWLTSFSLNLNCRITSTSVGLGVSVPWQEKMTPGSPSLPYRPLIIPISQFPYQPLIIPISQFPYQPLPCHVKSGLDLATSPSWRHTAPIGERPHHLWRPAWVSRSGGDNPNITSFDIREGVSAEVGAPHEVTPTELVMLARMGATVMGK